MNEEELLSQLSSLPLTPDNEGQQTTDIPLLVLLLFKRFVSKGPHDVAYDQIEPGLERLITQFTRTKKASAAVPFVQLDRRLWQLSAQDNTPINIGPARSSAWLRKQGARGSLRSEVFELLNSAKTLSQSIDLVLSTYFEAELAEAIRTELRLRLPSSVITSGSTKPPQRAEPPTSLELPANLAEYDFETRLRWHAFKWLDELCTTYDYKVPSSQLREFIFEGERISLDDNQMGIRKPRMLTSALSIKTTYTRPSQEAPYADEEYPDGIIGYKYQGTDPNLYTNKALRSAWQEKRPLIWFVGVASGIFEPRFPLWIVDDQPEKLQVLASFDAPDGIDPIWRTLPRSRHP